mmetsp:Transcript_35561/g.34597  ORF Transcript_35561/g.34597 Transcript_35561/m.34597 type:complete len:139 (+) Transcript_35561:2791-3207(+)
MLVGKAEDKEKIEEEIMSQFDDRLSQGNLWQINVPEECVNKTYEKMFKFLLDRNLVSLGLYRFPGGMDNKYSYVFCNPDQKSNVSAKDKVFVLGKDIPKDLMADYNVDNALVNNSKKKQLSPAKAKKEGMFSGDNKRQ